MKHKKSSINLFLLVCFGAIFIGMAQTKQRKHKESFDVDKDVVLHINTSHTDLEIDTWDRGKVEIEAVLEIEDITDEEMDTYFKNWKYEALGNSKKITITSKSEGLFDFADLSNFEFPIIQHQDLNINLDHVFPDIKMDSLVIIMDDFPEFPSGVYEFVDDFSFDYEAYEKDGDKYLKKWKKEWKEKFDKKEFEKEMKAWKKEIESFKKDKKNLRKIQKEAQAEAKRARAEMRKVQSEAREAMKEAREAMREAQNEQRDAMREAREAYKDAMKESAKGRNGTSIFSLSDDGSDNLIIFSDQKKYKVKKTIKIKMPKKAKLKLNVRHGEVNLVSTSENMNAKLSHTTLYANVINGQQTTIESSFAPVHVLQWNDGLLKVNYVKDVSLQDVGYINLEANASNVLLGNLQNEAILNSTFGELEINTINTSFSNLDLILENTKAKLAIPNNAFTLYYIGTDSNIAYPESLQVKNNTTKFNTIVRGYHQSNNSNKAVNINARYSDVVVKENQ